MWPGIPEDVNPRIYLLWLIRSGRVTDWASLAEEFGIDIRILNTAQYVIFDYLESLQNAGLIAIEYAPEDNDYEFPRGVPRRIKLSENWRRSYNLRTRCKSTRTDTARFFGYYFHTIFGKA